MKKSPELVVRDYIQQKGGKINITVDDILKQLYPKQKEFVLSKALYKIYWGGRGAGKTTAVIADIIITLMTVFPEREGLIILASYDVEKTKTLYYHKLITAFDKINMNYTDKSAKNKIIVGNNIIQFVGLKDIPSADKAVGLATKKVYIDEPHTISVRILKHFIESVVKHRLHEFAPHGQLSMVGNPPKYKNAYLESFYKSTTCHVIPTTMFDNQSYSKEDIRKMHQEDADRMGLSYEEFLQTPESRRSVFGELVYENNTIIFKPSDNNTYLELPRITGKWDNVMGIDLGFIDKQAIVMCSYNKYMDTIYVTEEDQVAEENVTNLSKRVIRFYDKYLPEVSVIDTQGAGSKNIAAELSERYNGSWPYSC